MVRAVLSLLPVSVPRVDPLRVVTPRQGGTSRVHGSACFLQRDHQKWCDVLRPKLLKAVVETAHRVHGKVPETAVMCRLQLITRYSKSASGVSPGTAAHYLLPV